MSRQAVITRLGVGFVFTFTVVMLGAVHPTVGAVLSVFPALGTANQLLLWTSSAGGTDVVVSLSGSMLVGGAGVYG